MIFYTVFKEIMDLDWEPDIDPGDLDRQKSSSDIVILYLENMVTDT